MKTTGSIERFLCWLRCYLETIQKTRTNLCGLLFSIWYSAVSSRGKSQAGGFYWKPRSRVSHVKMKGRETLHGTSNVFIIVILQIMQKSGGRECQGGLNDRSRSSLFMEKERRNWIIYLYRVTRSKETSSRKKFRRGGVLENCDQFLVR